MSDNPEALTYSIDACDEAFVRDFCPYKGSPDPFVVWRAAWKSALAQQAATPITMPLADAQMLLSWMDETFGNGEGVDWQDEDAAAVGDALNKAIQNFKRMRAAVTDATPARQAATPTADALIPLIDDAEIEAGFRSYSWSEVPHAFRASVGFERGARWAIAQQAATPTDPDEMAAAEQAHMDVCNALARALGVKTWEPHEGEWDDAPRGNVLAILEAAGLYDPESGEIRQAATPAPDEAEHEAAMRVAVRTSPSVRLLAGEATPAPAEPVAEISQMNMVGTTPGRVITPLRDIRSFPIGTKLYAATPATPAAQPVELTGTPLNDACWSFVEAMPHKLPGPIWNDLKPAVKAAIERYLAEAPAAQAGDALPPGICDAKVPLGQIAREEFDAYCHEDSDYSESEAWEKAAQAVVAALAARGAQAGDEREAFETWAKGLAGAARLSLARHFGPGYVYSDTHAAWQAWQARAALKGQPEGQA